MELSRDKDQKVEEAPYMEMSLDIDQKTYESNNF